jgi:hypothetical protein
MIDFFRLRDIREDNDINQVRMAEILGVNRSAYSLWELGINIIPLNYLAFFADYFDYSIDYVLGLTNVRRKNNLIKGFDLKILGNNLKEVRIKNSLSQEDMARILNVTQPCITRYEKGLICISTSNIYKISKEFKISISKLCGKEK